MNINVNRQFILLDFALIDDPRFLDFVSAAEFGTYGVVKRIRTGRQNIYVLGEWYDYSEAQDGSKRLEWFYLEQKFGVSKADLAQKAKSELHPHAGQTWPKEPDINIEENREKNTVNGIVKGREKNTLQKLPDLREPPEKTEYVAEQILKALGDKQSQRFYHLALQRHLYALPKFAHAKPRVYSRRRPG